MQFKLMVNYKIKVQLRNYLLCTQSQKSMSRQQGKFMTMTTIGNAS